MPDPTLKKLLDRAFIEPTKKQQATYAKRSGMSHTEASAWRVEIKAGLRGANAVQHARLGPALEAARDAAIMEGITLGRIQESLERRALSEGEPLRKPSEILAIQLPKARAAFRRVLEEQTP